MHNGDLERELEDIAREIEDEDLLAKKRSRLREEFPPMCMEELSEILDLTIKEDCTNKTVVFLCCLSAYTEDSQFNCILAAPSSTGKSYIPIEVAKIFPEVDVKKVGYCSPTAFFHDNYLFDREHRTYVIDLERKILILLDQPRPDLLMRLRPLLSHDDKEIRAKITDKREKHGFRTKNVVLRGYPSVICCTAGLRLDEQEATRFIMLSPETTQEKIRLGVQEAIKKEADPVGYREMLNKHPGRQQLIKRIRAVKEEGIREIRIPSADLVQDRFMQRSACLKPRHQRDISHIISLIKSHALLNLWHRQEAEDPRVIIANGDDVDAGFVVWDEISLYQELNLPPYIHGLYTDVVVPAYQAKGRGLTRSDIQQAYFATHRRPIAPWTLDRSILPMLEMAGLIVLVPDETDRRRTLVIPMPVGTHMSDDDKGNRDQLGKEVID